MASGQNLEELPGWAAALVAAAPAGHLGVTDSEGRPRVLPVTFAVHDGAVWSAVDHKPKRVGEDDLARVRWLRERPEAALTVDRYDDDWERLAWVQVVGTAAVLEAAGHAAAIDALAARYPQYRDHRPGGLLLRLTPERVVWWRAAGGA